MQKSHRALPSGSFYERTGFHFGVALALMVGYWCAVVLLDAASDGFNVRYHNWSVSPAQLWWDRSIWYGAWVMVTPLVLVVLGRASPGTLGWKRALAAHALSHPALIALQVLMASSAFALIGPGVETIAAKAVRLFLTISLGRDLIFYCALVGIFYALSLRKRRLLDEIKVARIAAESAELARRLTDVKLDALRRELNPHVLFNALNSIGTLVRSGESAKAVRMLASMSTLLRAYLKPSSDAFVPLEKELDLLDRYLDMERVRLEDRLRVGITVDPSSLDCHVPSFILQPIVENAIKHGADRCRGSTLLRIEVGLLADEVRIRVVNESDTPPERGRPPGGEGEGLGLSNTRRRLEMLFGVDAHLELTLLPNGACVDILLPRGAGAGGAGASGAGPGHGAGHGESGGSGEPALRSRAG